MESSNRPSIKNPFPRQYYLSLFSYLKTPEFPDKGNLLLIFLARIPDLIIKRRMQRDKKLNFKERKTRKTVIGLLLLSFGIMEKPILLSQKRYKQQKSVTGSVFLFVFR